MQTEASHADVEMYDVVFVHVCDALTDLTQPADTLHLSVIVQLNDSCQQIDT